MVIKINIEVTLSHECAIGFLSIVSDIHMFYVIEAKVTAL